VRNSNVTNIDRLFPKSSAWHGMRTITNVVGLPYNFDAATHLHTNLNLHLLMCVRTPCIYMVSFRSTKAYLLVYLRGVVLKSRTHTEPKVVSMVLGKDVFQGLRF